MIREFHLPSDGTIEAGDIARRCPSSPRYSAISRGCTILSYPAVPTLYGLTSMANRAENKTSKW